MTAIRTLAVKGGQGLLTLLILSIAVFGLSRASGDPALAYLPASASAADIKAMDQRLGTDKPLLTQYVKFASRELRGDLGSSIATGTPVRVLIGQRIGNSVELALAALLLSILIGLPIGLYAGLRGHGLADKTLRSISTVGLAIPPFWLAIVLVLLLAVHVHLFPPSGAGGLSHLVLPAFVLAVPVAAGLVRLMRGAVLDIRSSDFVLAARARGVSERRVISRHILPNSLLSTITYLGLSLSTLVASAVVVEAVFAWPGLGNLAYSALLTRDMAVIQGAVLTWAVIIVVGSFAVDTLYVVLDPRIRVRGSRELS